MEECSFFFFFLNKEAKFYIKFTEISKLLKMYTVDVNMNYKHDFGSNKEKIYFKI